MPATQNQAPTIRVNGRAIKAARLRLGLTQPALSERTADLGRRMDTGQLSRYERGLAQPHPASLPVLARALGVETDDLLETTTGT